jgi:vancomycin resistance protein YoaR
MKSHMQKLGTYSTYSTNNANGNHNMRLALSKVNGLAVEPGATFSFDATTGNSTNASNGYLKAGAISGGKHIEEYGGGICQASTTIYGAAIRSNMEIVSRSNHLWASTYCPIGLDATVSYPYLDFKFKNPTKYPVYIVAGMSGTKLTVTFYGYQSPDYDSIQVTSKQTESIPMPAAVYKTDNSLAPGTKKLDVKGNGGRRATAQRIFYKNGSVVKTEALPSSYYSPVAPVYLVGPSGTTTPSTSTASSSSSSSSPAASTAP